MDLYSVSLMDEEGEAVRLDGSRELTIRILLPKRLLGEDFGLYTVESGSFKPLDFERVYLKGKTYIQFKSRTLETFALGKYKAPNKKKR